MTTSELTLIENEAAGFPVQLGVAVVLRDRHGCDWLSRGMSEEEMVAEGLEGIYKELE